MKRLAVTTLTQPTYRANGVDTVLVLNTPDFQIGTNNENFTLTVCLKPITLTGNHHFFTQQNGTADRKFGLYINTNRQIVNEFFATNNGLILNETIGPPLNLNEEYFIAFRYSRKSIVMTREGVNYTFSINDNVDVRQSTAPLTLGGQVLPSVNQVIDGELKHASIWTRFLSDEEISTLYSNVQKEKGEVPASGSLSYLDPSCYFYSTLKPNYNTIRDLSRNNITVNSINAIPNGFTRPQPRMMPMYTNRMRVHSPITTTEPGAATAGRAATAANHVPLFGMQLWINADAGGYTLNGDNLTVLDKSPVNRTINTLGKFTVQPNGIGTANAFLATTGAVRSYFETSLPLGMANDTPRTFFIVFQTPATHCNLFGYGNPSLDTMYDYLAYAPNAGVHLYINDMFAIGQPYKLNTPEVHAVVGGNSINNVYTRGIVETTYTTTLKTTDSALRIGYGIFDSYYTENLKIGEFIAYNRHLSGEEMKSVTDYLMRKFTKPYDYNIQNCYSHTPPLNGVRSFSFWYQKTGSSNTQYIVDLRNTSGGYFYFQSGGNADATGMNRVFFDTIQQNGGMTAPPADTWVRIYIEPRDTTVEIHLLKRFSESEFTEAKLADFRVYSRVWTTDELNDLSLSPSDSIVAAYNFKVNGGSLLKDISANNNDGTFYIL